MKKIGTLIAVLTLFIFPFQANAQYDVECPKNKQLVATTLNDKDDLISALEEIVPDTYGEVDYGNYYSEWEVTSALPMGQKKAQDDYENAKNYCGEAVTDKSWVVNLHFPLWEGKSASASKGQIYLAKSKEDGWFVWYRNH